MTRTSDRWYAGWFNQDYLNLYAHRTSQEARTVADLIAARLPDVRGGLTLDLGCGAGRHLPYLRERQPTVGLDLSPWLLDVARARTPHAPLARGDMRVLPFRDQAFTLVVSLFTSFGYFVDDEENQGVLAEVARVTAFDGWLVLDFLNAPNARRTLVPFERTQVGEQWIRQARSISDDGRFVTKTIRLEEGGREYVERVRLFEPDELMRMLRAGLRRHRVARRLYGRSVARDVAAGDRHRAATRRGLSATRAARRRWTRRRVMPGSPPLSVPQSPLGIDPQRD
jgi:SAM-dependent methyltransferase